MKLNIKKIKLEMERLGWSVEELAKRAGLNSRQMAYYYLKTKSFKGAVPFAKAFGIDPKDLIK